MKRAYSIGSSVSLPKMILIEVAFILNEKIMGTIFILQLFFLFSDTFSEELIFEQEF